MTGAGDWSAAGPVRVGIVVLAVLAGVLGLWSAVTPIAGAVLAAGRIDVSQSRQVLQHPDGGRIAAILVAEGDRVTAGEVVMRLDGQALLSDLAVIDTRLAGAFVEQARLEAERDRSTDIRFPADLGRLGVDPGVTASLKLTAARRLSARAAERSAEREQVLARDAQIARQIEGLAAQADAAGRQIALTDRDLETQRALLAKGLSQSSRVLATERERARLDGAFAGLVAQRAEAESRRSEALLDALKRDADGRGAVLSDLRTAAADVSELSERRAALLARIAGLELRAPAAGIVFGLQITSPGAVLKPADPALYIVPQDRPLVAEARIDPRDIADIHLGQTAFLRAAAADGRRVPDLAGEVTSIAPDALSDRTGEHAFYRVEIAIPESESRRLGPARMLPGMPVQVFLRTRDRTPLGYFVAPLTDYLGRAFRDG